MATQVGAAYVELGAKITGLERGLKDASRQVDAFGTTADKNAARVGARFQALGSRMSTVGRKMTLGLTLPIVGVGAAAFKMAADFERSMSKITGLVGIARGQVDSMRKGVLDLSKSTGKSAADLADGLFVITSAGLRGKDAMDALGAAGRASTAGLGEVSDIGRAVAGSMNAYGAATLNAADATDIITATARAGNFETSQLAAALGKVLPFAKQAGASLEQVGGAVALLTRTNGNASESITQMTALFRAFVVPTQEGKKILSEMGTSAEEVRDKIGRDGLVAALTDLDKGLGGNREQLGRLLGSSEAAGAAFQILDADASTLNDTFGTVSKSAGMTDEAFAAAADTAQFKMQQALANMQSALIELGGIIAPVVSKIAEGISSVVGAFSSLPGPVKTAAVAMAAFVAAIGPLLWMGGKVVGSIGAIKIAMAGMGAASAGTAAMGAAAGGAAGKVGMLGAAMPLLANPIGLTVAAVGLGIGALFMFRNELSASERFMQGMTESAGQHAQAMRQVNADYRAQVAAVSELNASNTTAAEARAKHSAAVQAYNNALAGGRKANETEIQFIRRLNALKVAAAQANVTATTATTQNTDATRKAVDGSTKLTQGITNESKAAADRVTKAQAQVDASKRFGMSQDVQRKAVAELASAQAGATLVEARRGQRLKEVEAQQLATRDAVKKSTMTDAEKKASLDIVNREINRTRTELKKVETAPDPKKKIKVDSADADRKLDNINTKLNNLDGKTVNPFVNVIERLVKGERAPGAYRGGYVQAFAEGGQVRGPGGRDRVPAMLTAGEVVLTKRQQAMVNGGMNIREAIRKTGGAFAKGGFVPPKKQKDEKPKAYAARVRQARAQWNASRDSTAAQGISAAFGSFSSNVLSRFDTDTSRILAGIEKSFTGTGALAGKSFADLDRDLSANLKNIERNFKGTGEFAGMTFKALEREMKKAQKQLNARFDALTPAEAQIKALTDSASAEDLAGALSEAQRELAEAQRFNDTDGIAAAQKKLRDAERAMMITELQKTAEAERAQRETEREAELEDFEDKWSEKRMRLQDQLDGQLEAERAAGEERRALLQQQLDERVAAEQAARDNLREKREFELMALEANMIETAKKYRGQAATIQKIMQTLARKMEISGRNVGKSLADGLNAAKGDLKGAARGLADLLSDWLKTASPTKVGPMSDLDHWWDGLAPALAEGIDTGAIEGSIATATSRPSLRMSAAAAGSVINLTVTDNTLAGMSREQADRVASQIKASLDRQIRIGI
jgi:TP901 family phage tail tape measure protein